MDINCVWVGGNISIMEKLSIILAQKAGFKVTLWSDLKTLDVPPNTIVKPLPNDVLPPTTFQGISLPSLPNGGIGSYSHWSDYFAFKILEKNGGYWMQLDLAILDKINIVQDYAFTGWGPRISPIFMKVPKDSQYCKKMIEDLEPFIRNNSKEQDWHYSMLLMYTNALRYDIFKNCVIIADGFVDCGGQNTSLYNSPSNNQKKNIMIHWSNATNNTDKNTPILNSEYYNLCLENGLI